MTHGVQGYFIERRHAARRVAGIAVALALSLLASLLTLAIPVLRDPARTVLRETARFGYEGPDQYVRRISLKQLAGSQTRTVELGAVHTRRARAGGAAKGRRSDDARARPEVRPDVEGTGTSKEELLQLAVSRLANVPVVQSEDLVIEYASTPVYPQEQIDRNIEGRVMVQALIDTTGRVVDVQLLASTGVTPFERSAAEAVWRYRFRPYRMAGTVQEVYAIFRFAFRIY